ncbi:DUF1330 domain-containing protein [Phaeobacter inhibens]|uniref:DUF1330 domain-containing protein n=1 Tax=Phaeobacter inhibens TaxID=221822 RepID=UPI00076BB8B8|nr:DUF1330 domain-containing protein [Phaeobacter inhibens]KXF91728.1 hypothetical protein AT574_05505 [Phaeobacter inhibens]WHP67186.1 DUF1330 domain-containing protein [Phaeobacter inhibens]
MAKGYWIAFVTVTDPDRYAGYQQQAPAAFAKYGARFLARGGAAETLEGTAYQRHVVIEFDSKATALACYHSPEYQSARTHRQAACTAQIAIVDGLEP